MAERLQQARARAGACLNTLRTNPTVVAVPGEGFLTRLGFSMVSFALPFYAVSLGMSLSEVGILYALRTATVVAIKPVMGWAADRYGRKNTLIASYSRDAGWKIGRYGISCIPASTAWSTSKMASR